VIFGQGTSVKRPHSVVLITTTTDAGGIVTAIDRATLDGRKDNICIKVLRYNRDDLGRSACRMAQG